jgi:hypothetical protein
METPVRLLINIASKHPDDHETFSLFLRMYEKELMDYEEFFIKMIYNAALEYLDLPQEEKCKIIKKYFEANFKRE